MSKKIISKKNYSEKQLKEKVAFWLDNNRWAALSLGVVAAGGLLTVGLFAPNLLMLLGKKKNYFSKKERGALSDARLRLLKQGYIKKIRVGSGQFVYKLSKKGLEKLANYDLEFELNEKQRKKWDKKWRLLLFDYPNTQQSTRDNIRRVAKNFGFYQFQKNVWVYPYENVYQILDYFHLLHGKGRDNLVVITTDRFVGDSVLRKHFNL